MQRAFLLLAALFSSASAAFHSGRSCKCGPSDSCWPSQAAWASLNNTVSGKLIETEPLAVSCYAGPSFNAAHCAKVDDQWTNATFQANSPVGYDYPRDLTCPPVNGSTTQLPASGPCTIGDSPRYAVNATVVDDISAAVKFAKQHNVRLVIKDTGHDILGRSTGYGSLEVWIRHLRTGLTFSESYESSCPATNYHGPSFSVGGGYTWENVYPIAQQNNVVVVGGGTPTVSVLGGWLQGGGHGPATRQYGLGADQVLSAQVVLADGCVITANACENQDVFFAIRGGGGGTYGVVAEVSIKAHPNFDVQMQSLSIAPLDISNTSSLLDAVAIIYEAIPDLNDGGFAGYGTWSIAQPTPLVGNSTAGYVHGIYLFNQSTDTAKKLFAPTLEKLKPYNGTSLSITVDYTSFPDYWDFYYKAAAVNGPVGTASALGSRLFSRRSVQEDPAGLREMIGVIAGTPEEFTSNSLEIVGGGAVFSGGSDPLSGVNPAWRISYFNNIVARGWAPGSNQSVIDATQNDITYVKDAAMNKQAWDTGVYMNEANRLDPDYPWNFYGLHYGPLLAIKNFRDPAGVFYCVTCVGSAEWKENAEGVLCPLS
ncbi:hypothetical protein M409DRAFT_29388 [Zasmidium cellare ATCC 36951]|uniref:FAD-binding PCMH-type domain-containing protein n=1 Tax=Zasmidium cellare ATCC 36951 TaxID=1080233 RepID=A0A6A6C1R0_ZASCE|nr:uncharacterized protein M409DRAFT_29388 [Zasmidium cellare ATCC 36951]KAF2160090.1 hypothetical protein M409DRAFT_29388 [Zasmidium cellare ATCC 36951]